MCTGALPGERSWAWALPSPITTVPAIIYAMCRQVVAERRCALLDMIESILVNYGHSADNSVSANTTLCFGPHPLINKSWVFLRWRFHSQEDSRS